MSNSTLSGRTVGPLVIIVLIAGGLAAWGLLGTDTDPVSVSSAPPKTPSTKPDAPNVNGAAIRPETERVPPRPIDPRVRPGGPTWDDVEFAFSTFDEIRLQPKVHRSAGSAFDLEASKLLHEKTLALRSLGEIVEVGVAMESVDAADGEAKVDEAREKMALAMADLPVPSYVTNPDAAEAYRVRMAERALAVLDAIDPENLQPLRGNDPSDLEAAPDEADATEDAEL
ncbi:MAG: hypothetical protein AAGA48_16200 [Myxococcota bacterium]